MTNNNLVITDAMSGHDPASVSKPSFSGKTRRRRDEDGGPKKPKNLESRWFRESWGIILLCAIL